MFSTLDLRKPGETKHGSFITDDSDYAVVYAIEKCPRSERTNQPLTKKYVDEEHSPEPVMAVTVSFPCRSDFLVSYLFFSYFAHLFL